MRAPSAASTVIAVLLVSACASTPALQEDREVDPCSFGCQVFTAMFEGLFTAAFDSVFSTGERRHHSHESWAAAPAPQSYASLSGHKKHKKEGRK